MKFKILVLVFLCISFALSKLLGAGPITHAYLTEVFFEKYPIYEESQKNSFRRGTLFADIRYLTNEIDRSDTHFAQITIEDILQEPSAFMAGLKFHSFVDIVREEFVVEKNVYSVISPQLTTHYGSLLKLIEDEILFTKLNKNIWHKALKQYDPEEFFWEIDNKIIAKWHFMLDMCFLNSPETLISLFSQTDKDLFNIPSQELVYWNEIIPGLIDDVFLQEYVSEMINHFKYICEKN